MKKNSICIDTTLVGSIIPELFEFYKGSTLDYNSLYREYEKEARVFLNSKDNEFEKQLIVDLQQKNDFLHDFYQNKNTYSVVIKVSKEERSNLLFHMALGFTNFCVVIKNVIQGTKEPEVLTMKRQVSPPAKAYGVFPGNGVTTVGGGSF
jgi:hypothetical protein